MSIKAVLFDLDGVLYNGAPLHFQALNQALVECGYCSIGLEEHKRIFDGLPTVEKLKRLVIEGRIKDGHVTRIKKSKQLHTINLLRTMVKFDPDIFCLIKGVEKTVKWGVVTNAVAETAMVVLELMRLGHPDVLVTNEECVPKPDPAPYLLGCSRLGLNPAEVLCVEDGKYGVQSVLGAGCKLAQVSGPKDVTPQLIFSYLV